MLKHKSLWFYHVTSQNDENECNPILKYEGTFKEKYQYFLDDFKSSFPKTPLKELKKLARKTAKKPKLPKPSDVYDMWALCCFSAK